MDKFNANESVDTTRLEKLFLESGTLKVFRKNEYMVRQNDKTNHIGFVASGIFRLTRIDMNGNEWIVGYSFENDFVCDYPSLINRPMQRLAYRQQLIARSIYYLYANSTNFGKPIWKHSV